MNKSEMLSTFTCTKDEVFRDMQNCLFGFMHSVKHPEMYSKDKLNDLFAQAKFLTARADEVDFVRVPHRIYGSIVDFIFNCCVPLKEKAPEMFANWECDRIESLAEFFDEKDY